MATGRKIQQLQRLLGQGRKNLYLAKPTLLPQPVASIFLFKAL
jgi:hypothetical protein